MFSTRRMFALALAGVFAASLASNAIAETTWQQNHPRRAEVNRRLNNQNRRIHREVKEGELSKQQAAGLHAQDHNVRQEERAMARNDNGHITKADKRALNQQENGISKEIGQ
jgi:hypothetical protein